MPTGETRAREMRGRPRGRTRDTIGLLSLLLVGLFFLNALQLPDGYRIYMAIVVANWVLLFAVAVGRRRARLGGVWLLVALSPLCMLGAVLPLTLLSKRARASVRPDLAAAPGAFRAAAGGIWKALTPSSFPLGAPTVWRLILAVVISAAVLVAWFVFMTLWLGLSGANPSTTLILWWIFAPPGVLAVLTLSYFVAGWLRARRSGQEEPEPDSRPDCG